MKLKPGRIILAVLLLFLLVWGANKFIAWRRPPEVTVTAPARVPADELFLIEVNSSKDSTMSLVVGDAELTGHGDHWTVYLPGAAGAFELQLSVQDRVGNVVERLVAVTGVAAPVVELQATVDVLAGDPVAALFSVDPGDNAIQGVTVRLDGQDLPLLTLGAGRAALAAEPFSLEPAESLLELEVQDDLGRSTVLSRTVTVRPIERQIEVLQLAGEVLALRSDENAASQNALLDEALASPEPLPLWTEPFIMPVSGFASSGYGDPRQYGAGGEVSFHTGADLAAPSGTEVHATNDGVVVLARELPINGGTVVIDHGGGVTSRYYHLSLIETEVGRAVSRGDVIAEVGTTGLSTGPHLHWEMRVGNVPTNPLPWVDRLLPGLDAAR